MTTPDEAHDLREALDRGEWQRLADPLALILAMADPPWWSRATLRCLDEIAHALHLPQPGHARAYAPSTMGADLRRLRLLMRLAWRPMPLEIDAALAVLERWRP